MSTALTANGQSVDLSEADAGSLHYATSTVTFLHATCTVYTPAPAGGSYVNHATCTHKHPDTREGYQAMQECADKLARIIRSGRLPKWATLA